MDRETLRLLLAQGLSLDQIARCFGRDGSTIGYWVRKHGLEPVHRGRHAPRGGIQRDALEALVARGLSMRAMAKELDRSLPTVRHWMRKHGLTANAYVRCSDSLPEKAPEIRRMCRSHGMTVFILRRSGYRCKRCESKRVAARRRKVKRILIAEAGGACILCGYDGCPAALQFHHLEPEEKSFALSRRGVTRSIAEARAEARKCVLLCANCHAEVEAGVATVGEGSVE